MKKWMTLFLVICLCVSLSGCMATIQGITINENGSGTITVAVGYTEEGLKMIQQMEMEQGESVTQIDLDEYTKFEYNGVTYYGEVSEQSFDSIDALNESDVVQDAAFLQFSRQENGDYAVKAIIPPMEEEETPPDSEEDAMEQEILETMVVVYQIAFPYPVVQTEGISDGVVVEGNHLELDVMELAKSAQSQELSLTFVSGKDVATVGFDDVKPEDWFYAAVTKMAAGKLVLGVSDRLFDPEGTLTYAQFCQILARAKNLQSGEANGYWAYHAIASCVKEGYIFDLGEVTEANYDVAIPRQAAVSGMYLARKGSGEQNMDITSADIPDYTEIAPEYRENVVAAYQMGITRGVDEKGTFLPDRSLTRAEICQLFYNLNWVTAQ